MSARIFYGGRWWQLVPKEPRRPDGAADRGYMLLDRRGRHTGVLLGSRRMVERWVAERRRGGAA